MFTAAPAAAACQEWELIAEPGHDGVASAWLVERLTAVASELASLSTKLELAPASIDNLELAPGTRLIVTAAIEPHRSSRLAVSVVARHAAPRGPVAALAVMTFARRGDPHPLFALPQPHGSHPVTARFAGKGRGNALAWVQATAQLSAQSASGRAVTFAGLEALSVIEWLQGGEPLLLECSVVAQKTRELTVLSHLIHETTGRSVLCALGRWTPHQEQS